MFRDTVTRRPDGPLVSRKQESRDALLFPTIYTSQRIKALLTLFLHIRASVYSVYKCIYKNKSEIFSFTHRRDIKIDLHNIISAYDVKGHFEAHQ